MFRGIWSMDTAGPISRTVEDAAITLAAIAGHDPQDPYSWNAPVPDYRVALDGSVRGLRVGLITEHLRDPMTEPDTRDAVVKAASVLEGLGAAVEEVSLPLSPNPPKDTDGRREDSGRGWVRELQGRWPGVLG